MTPRFTQFTLKINRLHKLILKLKSDGMGQFGLRGADTICLYQLSQADSMTFAQLVEDCDLDAALISRTLRELVRNGLVAKEGGKYKASYSLTQEGRTLTAQVTSIIRKVQANADRGVDPKELQIFYRVLEQLTENFQQMAREPATILPDLSKQEETP